MKKLFLSLLAIPLLCAGASYAEQPESKEVFEKVIEFIDLSTDHANDWMSYVEERQTAKFELIKKHKDECAELHIKKMEMIRDNGFSTQLLEKFLLKAIALHESQIANWKKYQMVSEMLAHKLCEDHNKELTQFKAS